MFIFLKLTKNHIFVELTQNTTRLLI